MKYKVGQKVRIVQDRTLGMNSSGLMDKYLGTVMTIRSDNYFGAYSMVEDRGDWCWSNTMIVGPAGIEVL